MLIELTPKAWQTRRWRALDEGAFFVDDSDIAFAARTISGGRGAATFAKDAGKVMHIGQSDGGGDGFDRLVGVAQQMARAVSM